jgi:hypothetical protein
MLQWDEFIDSWYILPPTFGQPVPMTGSVVIARGNPIRSVLLTCNYNFWWEINEKRKHQIDWLSISIINCWIATVGGFWIDDSLYCALWYNAWPHFKQFTITHTYTHTHTHTLESTVTSSLPLLGNGFQQRTYPFSGFPNCPWPQLPSSNSNSLQLLFSNWLQLLNAPGYNISARTT